MAGSGVAVVRRPVLGGKRIGQRQPAAPATDSTLGPFAYSLDRLLPLVDLGQGSTWPAGPDWTHALRWVAYFESGFGWIAALLLLASIAGWVDRDRQR